MSRPLAAALTVFCMYDSHLTLGVPREMVPARLLDRRLPSNPVALRMVNKRVPGSDVGTTRSNLYVAEWRKGCPLKSRNLNVTTPDPLNSVAKVGEVN